MPACNPVSVVLVPLPEKPPGFIVQFIAGGKSLNTTLPVDTVHVGWVIVPTSGVTLYELITTTSDEGEVHQSELVTVKV